MKSRIVLFLAVIVVFASCNNRTEKKEEPIKQKSFGTSDWETMKLIGEVKSINEIKYYRFTEPDSPKNKIANRIQIVFNENGFLLEKSNFGSENILIYSEGYEYDDNGKLIKISMTNIDRQCMGYKECKLDENGLLIAQIDKNCDNEIRSNVEMKYNAAGKVSEIAYLSVDKKDLLMKLTYLYDDKDNLIESTFFEVTNAVETKTKYTYEEHGLESTRESFNSAGKVTESLQFEYEFDKNSNWIKRKISQAGVLKFVIEREIVYYQ